MLAKFLVAIHPSLVFNSSSILLPQFYIFCRDRTPHAHVSLHSLNTQTLNRFHMHYISSLHLRFPKPHNDVGNYYRWPQTLVELSSLKLDHQQASWPTAD